MAVEPDRIATSMCSSILNIAIDGVALRLVDEGFASHLASVVIKMFDVGETRCKLMFSGKALFLCVSFVGTLWPRIDIYGPGVLY